VRRSMDRNKLLLIPPNGHSEDRQFFVNRNSTVHSLRTFYVHTFTRQLRVYGHTLVYLFVICLYIVKHILAHIGVHIFLL